MDWGLKIFDIGVSSFSISYETVFFCENICSTTQKPIPSLDLTLSQSIPYTSLSSACKTCIFVQLFYIFGKQNAHLQINFPLILFFSSSFLYYRHRPLAYVLLHLLNYA